MARLFLTSRELNFISDITKEVIKDIIGQRIYLYPVSELKTKTHDVYNEAVKKMFDNPIIVDCLVDNNFQSETKTDMFGVDAQFKIEVYIQYRDLVDKNIAIAIGDFFSYSDIFYEISDKTIMRNIYGFAEHRAGVKLVGTKARESQFKTKLLGPTDISRPEPDAVQKEFYQQRGQESNAEGITGDIRDLQKEEVLGKPLTGAKKVTPEGDTERSGTSAFYDDE